MKLAHVFKSHALSDLNAVNRFIKMKLAHVFKSHALSDLNAVNRFIKILLYIVTARFLSYCSDAAR